MNAEYFPAPGKCSVSALREEVEELLTALLDLATEGIISFLLPGS